MARYAITTLAIAAIILTTAGGAGAAAPEEPRELTVLAYNTHLFEDSAVECPCRCCDDWPWCHSCDWEKMQYEDQLRRDVIALLVEASGADIVVLQEVWCPAWQQWFINNEQLKSAYPYAHSFDPLCKPYFAPLSQIWTCINVCSVASGAWKWHTQGNGLVLLSKRPLSNVEFERFPTFEQCSIGACDVWADKGVLTADVNVGGVKIRVGVSHALGGAHDRSKWDRNFNANTTTPFQLKGETYIFALGSDSNGYIFRMEDHGRWWDEKEEKYNSGGGWKHIYGEYLGHDYYVVTSFELDGHPYLFTSSDTDRYAYIFRINDDPSTGLTPIYEGVWDVDTPGPGYTDLAAWYQFEGDANDSSGNNHNGTVNGEPNYSHFCKERSYSIALDGEDDYVHVGEVGINSTKSRTIAGWVRATMTPPGWTNVFGFTSTEGIDNTHFDIEYSGASSTNHYCIHVHGWQQNIAPFDREWHHLAATYDNSSNTIAWYADGSWVGSAVRTLNINDHVQIGRRADGDGGYFPGYVDDVRIYSRALLQEEIGYLAGRLGYNSVTSFELDGHPYLFTLDANDQAYITRINDEPCTGWTRMYKGAWDADTPGPVYTGLAAWYQFEGDANDSGDYGHHGTVNEDQDYIYVCKERRHSIALDGEDDYVHVGEIGINSSQSRTIAGWVRATMTPPGWTNVFGFTGPPINNTHFDIERSGASGSNHYCIHVRGWQQNIAPFDREWHHLAATYDNSSNTIAWYADGILVGSAVRTLSINDHVQIGKRFDNDNYFPGLVDDVRIYSRALSRGEIGSLATQGYNAVTSFELDAHPYLFALHADNKAYIHRIKDDPCTGWTTIYDGNMSSEHFNVTSFELDGHPYLFATHTNNNAYIHRIKDDPCEGLTYVYGDPCDEYMKAWYRFELNTNDTTVNGNDGTSFGGPTYNIDSRGETYSLELDGDNDYVAVDPIGIDSNDPRTIAGWVKASTAASTKDWACVFGFTSTGVDKTHFDIECRGGENYYCIHVYGWHQVIAELDWQWHHLAATYDGKDITWYVDGSRVNSAAVELNTNDHVRIGKREDTGDYFPGLVDDVRIYSRALSQGEIAQLARSSITVFEINGHPYLFLEGNCCEKYDDITFCRQRPGEAYMKRINDDPCTGWEDLLQLDDIRIIRDRTVVDEDGPPAIMMGDFNIHQDKYGIMNELFGKAGAVDAYIEVHGSDIGGETGDFSNNRLARLFCPGDPDFCVPENHPPNRVNYVYVRQSGAGLRLVPTEAHVFRDWTYESSDYGTIDLSDHYPIAVKFQLFEGGCTARAKGDLNCDRLINFADLSILCSAWMSRPGDGVWDPACDISDPNDNVIDTKDVYVIARSWLTMPVHNVTRNTWYGFIQTAIDDANDGDEIEVAPGTYYEAIDFKGKAIRLYSSGGPENTTIEPKGIGGAYHVVKCVSGEDTNTILENFTITGGNANGFDPNEKCGGGMYNYKSSPTVINCTFSGNSAAYDGGGMYNDQSSPTVTDCTFSNNKATNGGGGMRNWISSPTVTNCKFTGNSAQHAGGMFNDNGSSPMVTNCIFSTNSTTGIGGGMFNLTNSSPTLTNCTFSGNSAGSGGSGMDNRVSSNPNVTNCIIWGNEPNEIYNYSANPIVTYSDIHGGTGQSWFGTGCIDADPCFVDVDNPDPNLWNLRLKPDSPCIDTGDNVSLPPDTADLDDDGDTTEKIPYDLDDNDRVWNGIVDMGSYEYLIPPPPVSTADNFEYLAMICANWLVGTKPEL